MTPQNEQSPFQRLAMRRSEGTLISRLADGTVYADHAGAALHCDAQATAMATLLNSALFINPHSGNAGGEDRIAAMRRRVLQVIQRMCGRKNLTYTLTRTKSLLARIRASTQSSGLPAPRRH